MDNWGRAGGRTRIGAFAALVGMAAAGAVAPGTAGAAAVPPVTAPPSRVAVTWGACGSWWTETATQTESGSVCGVDGLVTDNGRPTQLAEPLISVARYVCPKRRGDCRDETYTGTVRRSEMTVDPFLRRASIRGTLGGCTLDVEFAGLGPVQPGGGVWENHGLSGATPTISAGGSQTFTSQASWWGGVCGRTIVAAPAEEGRQAWMYRSVEASAGGFGGDGCHADADAAATRPMTAC